MASAMFRALKAAAPQAPTNIVNADIQVVEDIFDGETTRRVVSIDTTPRATGPRPKFRPMEAGHVFTPPVEAKPVKDSPSNNYDLVGDDMGAAPERKSNAGRKRLFQSNAERQAAYRSRKKS